MSILWDVKKGTDLSSKVVMKRFSKVLADYQAENASAPDVTFFIGLASGSDQELLHIILNLPAEARSQLLESLRNYDTKLNKNPIKPAHKKLPHASPDQDLEVPIVHPEETVREIQEWDF